MCYPPNYWIIPSFYEYVVYAFPFWQKIYWYNCISLKIQSVGMSVNWFSIILLMLKTAGLKRDKFWVICWIPLQRQIAVTSKSRGNWVILTYRHQNTQCNISNLPGWASPSTDLWFQRLTSTQSGDPLLCCCWLYIWKFDKVYPNFLVQNENV